MNRGGDVFSVAFTGPVATVTLARPPVNAIDPGWVASLHAALDAVDERRDAVSVVHLRATGRAFCAGADLGWVRERFSSPDGVRRFPEEVRAIQLVFRRLERLPQATVAEIGGAAMGGGLELALSCDMRIASETAWLGLPEIAIGLLPGAGGTQRLTRLCGKPTALRMILTGDPVRGAEALSLGVVQWSVPADELELAALRLVGRLASMPRTALAACKASIAEATRPGDEGFESDIDATGMLLQTPEAQERIAAFLDGKR